MQFVNDYNEHLPFFLLSASSHLLSDTLDVTSTVLALRTLGTFDFEGENKVNTNLCQMMTLEEVKNLTLLYIIMYMNRTTQRFSYDLEMKTREQKRNNKRTEIQQFDWFIERIQTHLAFGWLSERSAEKTSCPKNLLEIALTSYCNRIGQSNNAFSILGFSLAGKRRVYVWFFSSIG